MAATMEASRSAELRARVLVKSAAPGELRLRRERLGLSLRQLAGELGVSHTLVWRWESGECLPPPARALRWLQLLRRLEDPGLAQ